MIFILIIAFILRIINLNQSLWLDEGIETIAVKSNSLIDLVTKYAVNDYSPPLYHAVLKLWTNIFGYSEIALRLPSVIFGVLAVYFVYKIAGKKLGMIAGTFMALNPLAIYYSQEARRYSMAAAAVTASVWFFSKKNWPAWAIFFIIALYTDYLVWFMIPVFFLCKKRTAIIVLFLIPALFLLKEQLIAGMGLAQTSPLWGQVVGGLDPKSVPLVLSKFVFGRISIGYFAIISILYLWILASARTRFNWLWLGVPIIMGFIISFKIPVFSYFRFLFVLPAFVLLLAEGVKNKKQIGVICLISLISLIWFQINPRFQREDWRGVAKYVQNSKVYMPSVAQSASLKYYNPGVRVNDVTNINIGQDRTVYLIRYVQEIFDQRDFLRRVLELSGYVKTEEKVFNGVVVWKYQL